MKVKELIDKLSLLDNDVEVKVGYGCYVEPINFIFPQSKCVVLHPNVYDGDKAELWAQTLVKFYKKNN